MASSYIFTCRSCGFSIEAWDDGNPYIEFPAGKRNYFYHPDEDRTIRKISTLITGHVPTLEERKAVLAEHGGNESDYICRSCKKEIRLDPKRDLLACVHCKSANIEDLLNLPGKKCIQCDSAFPKGEPGAIS